MLAIVGGTGLYKLEQIEVIDKIKVNTPFGIPSAEIIKAKYNNQAFLFIPRHGEHHQYLPHEINYQANIFALKKLGALQILSVSAVGSLRENIEPGELVIPSQYFDWIKGKRDSTFFGTGLAAHISTAEPTCLDLTSWIIKQANKLNIKVHNDKTYACVDGPRLGTIAESNFLRNIGCDLVGMTNIPEVFLAREAQICYATLGIVTDFDCWKQDGTAHATVTDVIDRYTKTLDKVKQLLFSLLAIGVPSINHSYRESLAEAILTPIDVIPESKKSLLEVLKV